MTDRTIIRIHIISVGRTPEEITDFVGLSCDKSWRIGDKRGKTIIEQKNNGWILESGLAESAPLDMHIEALLQRITPYADRIRSLSSQDTVELSCVVYAAAPPALNFSSCVIGQIGELGASLDIDLYILPDE